MLPKIKEGYCSRLKAASKRIIECCLTPVDCRQTLRLSGLKPIFLIQDDDYFLPAYLNAQLPSAIRDNVLEAIRRRLITVRSRIMRSFDATVVLLIQVRGMDDRNIEQNLCDFCDSRFQAFQATVKTVLEQIIHAEQSDRDASRRSYSFSSVGENV